MKKLFLALLLLFTAVPQAVADDAVDAKGTRLGCKDVTATGEWDAVASSDLVDAASATALPANLYWTLVEILNGSAAVHVCTTGASSCGSDGTSKPVVQAGAYRSISTRALATKTISVLAAEGTTVQVCGYVRVVP